DISLTCSVSADAYSFLHIILYGTSTTAIYTLSLHDALPISELAAIPVPAQNRLQQQDALVADKAARVTALNAALSKRIAWDRVLREFALVLPDDVWLLSLSATAPSSATVTATSTTTSTSSTPTLGGQLG